MEPNAGKLSGHLPLTEISASHNQKIVSFSYLIAAPRPLVTVLFQIAGQ